MCKNPLYKFLTGNNYNSIATKLDFENGNAIAVKCGKCFSCMCLKINQIESKFNLYVDWLKKHNEKFYCYFITLTYNDDNLKKTQLQSSKLEVQKFLKRIRFNHDLKKLKYVCTTELGGKKGRIHHHLFLVAEKDFLPVQTGGKNVKGYYYYQHPKIYWDNGFHSIKNINTDNRINITKTLKYVLKYVLKSPVNLMISKKIAYEAIEAIENKETSTYMYNGYKFKSPWYSKKQPPLPNIKKIELNREMFKKSNNKLLKPLRLENKDPEIW